MSAPHDAPSSRELLEAVREFLIRDVMEATDGRVRFHTRVAINVLAMVERELTLGETQRREHTERLRALGVDGEAALAAAIRDGTLDERRDEVIAAIRATVRAKLAVANPSHLDSPDSP